MKKLLSLTIALLLLMSGCAADSSPVSADIFAMDTYMNVRVWGSRADEAAKAAEAEIHRLDSLLSISSSGGELYAANRDGAAQLSAETAGVLRAALTAQELTGGAFDPTMLPLMELWGFTTGEYAVPDDAELSSALALTGRGRVTLEGERVSLAEGTQLDFGGIAKGYASDRVIDLMRSMGAESAIVTLGGNVQTLGSKPGGEAWRIAIRDPEDAAENLGVVSVRDMAVVTSGGYERYFEADGKSYHHIIDPATGRPAESGLVSVTIICSEGITADILSTALFVMGLEASTEFWRSGAYSFEAILLDDAGELWVTEGIADSFETARKTNIIES